MQTIKHDLGSIIRDLDALQRSRLPDAARRALYETGPHMRAFHAREMRAVFRDPVFYTLRSPSLGSEQGLDVRLSSTFIATINST